MSFYDDGFQLSVKDELRSKNDTHPEEDFDGRRFKGIVNTFYHEKAYGFIKGEDGLEVFVHRRHITTPGHVVLHPGQFVSFRKNKDHEGRVEAADVDIRPQDPSERQRGRVLQFNEDRCFGFIIAYDGGSDIFFHIDQIRVDYTEVNQQGHPQLELFPGMFVEYTLMHQEDGKRRAIDVTGPNEQPLSFQKMPDQQKQGPYDSGGKFTHYKDRPRGNFRDNGGWRGGRGRGRGGYRDRFNSYDYKYHDRWQNDREGRGFGGRRGGRRDNYNDRDRWGGPYDGGRRYGGSGFSRGFDDSYNNDRGNPQSDRRDSSRPDQARFSDRQYKSHGFRGEYDGKSYSTAPPPESPQFSMPMRETKRRPPADAVQGSTKRPAEGSQNPPAKRSKKLRHVTVHPNPISIDQSPTDNGTVLTIKNMNDFDLIFKFRTNQPRLVAVSRRIGVLPSKTKLRVNISGKGLPNDSGNDLFLVLLTAKTQIVGKPDFAKMKEMWSKINQTEIAQCKIQVMLEIFSD